MGKMQIQHKVSFWESDYDDQEKEVYLRELGGAVQNYIKTGVKNKQLDDMIVLEKQFQEKYEQRFDVEEIIDAAFKIDSKDIQELEEMSMSLEGSTDGNIAKSIGNLSVAFVGTNTNAAGAMGSSVLGALTDLIQKNVKEKLEKILKDAAYLSHINMLFELYEEEKKLRRQQKEFEQISDEYQNMAAVAKKLSEHKRIEIKDVETQIGISQDEFVDILNSCHKYFNIRNIKNRMQVSLSPVGRKYTEYIFCSENKYTNKALNQITFQNCDRLLTSLEKSFKKGIVYEIRLEGLQPDNERAIKHKFRNITYELISEKEDMYQIAEFHTVKTREREDMDEENRIRIPGRSGHEINQDIYWTV